MGKNTIGIPVATSATSGIDGAAAGARKGAPVDAPVRQLGAVRWKDAPTRRIDVSGVPFVYRELGTDAGVPVVFLHHLMAVLDDWDPRVIDGIARSAGVDHKFRAQRLGP